MITEAVFQGGAKHVTSAVASTLYRGSPRVVVYEASSTGSTINLWVASSSDSIGGPYYIIVNRSGRSLQLYDPVSSSNVGTAVANGKSAWVSMRSNSGSLPVNQWHVDIRDAPALSHAVGTRSSPTDFSDTAVRVYNDPGCLNNCADFLVLDPTSIVVPMFMDSARALNSKREPIRAADMRLPTQFGIAFERGQFVADANHPHAGNFSQDAYDALFGIEGADAVSKWHVLTYGGSIPGASRHWHHIRYVGTPGGGGTWTLDAAFTVRRHYWVKTITYVRQSDQQTFSIEIRVSLEHSVTTEPVPGPTPASSTNDATRGAWGSLINIQVFCNELDSTYIDGNNFTPHGWSSGIPFTRNDPSVWGGNYAVKGGTSAHKVNHPHMLFTACVPTTMESPSGFDWYESKDERISYCSHRASGVPWTASTIPTTTVWSNAVFGPMYGATVYHGCMTLGGDFPYSEPMDWVTVENQAGTGWTYFKCTKPGWDEVEGTLDLVTGTAIQLCILPQAEDQNALNSCTGHPDEPLAGIGGTHRCFMTQAAGCCISIRDVDDEPAMAGMSLYQTCIRVEVYNGDPSGGSCTPLGGGCFDLGSFATGFALPCSNYDYMLGTSASGRTIRYNAWYNDPTVSKYSYTYALSSHAYVYSRVGTVTFGASGWTVASVTGATYSNVTTYAPPSSTFDDATVSGTVPLSASYTAGFTLRSSVSGGALTGYTAIFNKTADTVSIYRVVAGTETLLAQKTTAGISSLTSIAATFACVGSEFTVTWGASTLTAHSCSNTGGGEPGWVTRGSSVGSTFAGTPAIVDATQSWIEVAVNYDLSLCTTGVMQLVLLSGYGRCAESSSDVLCGTDDLHCNCTQWGQSLGGVTLPSGCTATANLTFDAAMPTLMKQKCYGNLPCDSSVPNCGSCPPPQIISRLSLPGCKNHVTEASEPSLGGVTCGGSSVWGASFIYCV